MPISYRLRKYQHARLVYSVRSSAAAAGHTNVFNVSVVEVGGLVVACYRAFGPARQKPFHAYTLTIDGAGATSLHDLTAHCEAAGIRPTADPKIFVVGDSVYATFNTGTPSSGPNDIYLVRVAPTPGVPQRVELVGRDRTRVEKNWAFHHTADERGVAPETGLQGIYSLAPFVTLRQVDGGLGSDSTIVLEASEHDARRHGGFPKQMTIGTQPVRSASGELVLVAHERFAIAGKRAYVGRALRIRDDARGNVDLTISPRRLVHSFAAAVPRRGVHNPNLLSATYFSGLDVVGDTLRMSYGVNDVDFGIADVKETALWV